MNPGAGPKNPTKISPGPPAKPTTLNPKPKNPKLQNHIDSEFEETPQVASAPLMESAGTPEQKSQGMQGLGFRVSGFRRAKPEAQTRNVLPYLLPFFDRTAEASTKSEEFNSHA